MNEAPDEFAWIERLAPLTRGDPRALRLLDDVAVIPSRAGFDLIISKDAMVQGVHFLHDEAPETVARRLLRTSLSDLAAKGAEPFGYFLMTAWPTGGGWAERDAFVRGLASDGEAFGVSLLGGDTVRTTGPMTLSATVLGWCPAGKAVLRSGARSGDALVVCGAIGDGWLGLEAAQGRISDPAGRLSAHYRAPRPLLHLRGLLLERAKAAADVSDGLIADAAHIAYASGLGLDLDLISMPLSADGAGWILDQPDADAARITLATGGDDYAIVCAVAPEDLGDFIRDAEELDAVAVRVGQFTDAAGVSVRVGERVANVERMGWTH